MKELTAQEKAKAYDEAIKNMRKFRDALSNHEETDLWVLKKEIVTDIEYYFPELKESDANHPNGCIVLEDFNAGEGFYKVHLDYLSRKQVEVIEEMVRTWNNDSKAPDEDIKSCIGMCLTDAHEQRFKDYNTSLKDCLAWLEMQGGQEEPQVVEPKFKFGDWVVRGDTIAQILDIQEQYYIGLDINGKDFTSSRFLNADKIHLWTIKDAKDGDVIQLGGVTAIFKEYIGNQYCKCYCSVYDGEFGIPSQDGKDNIYGCTNATPAAKEQRDLLFQKMKESGYEWNAEELRLDKVEPKFKVGDWIVTPQNKAIEITSIEGTCYCFNNTSHYWESYYCDQECHLWTISDAKDGDVLVDEDNNIGIYWGEADDLEWHSYIYLGCDNHLYGFNIGGYHIIRRTKPATKEQRDLLFQKMKESGYEWNDEKKELKRIEDEEYEGEDYGIDGLWHAKNILEKTLGKVEGYQTDDGILDHKCAISVVDRLYKNKPAWSAEDTFKVQSICKHLDEAKKYCADIAEVIECWNWLKSIKDRYAWKPSDEQMGALANACDGKILNLDYLNSLYQGLKKLKE